MLVPAVLASTGRLTLGEGTDTEVLLLVAAMLYGLSLVERSSQVGLGGMIAYLEQVADQPRMKPMPLKPGRRSTKLGSCSPL